MLRLTLAHVLASLLAIDAVGPGALAPALAAPFTQPAASKGTPVGWRTLGLLDLRTGLPGAELKQVAGTTVMIPGYIVPFEDMTETVKEFLLVPYVGACVHTPPPPANQMVYVTMARGKSAAFQMWRPVWIEGTLEIDTKQSIYGAAGFTVRATRVFPYEM